MSKRIQKLIQLFAPLLSIIIGVNTLSSCSEDNPSSNLQLDADKEIIIQHLADSNIEAYSSIDSLGLYYEVLQEAESSENVSGKILSMYYSLTLLDGTVLDSVSRNNNDDSTLVQHGTNSIYPIGIDHALGLMNVGDIYKFYIPSSLGYGNHNLDGIPENSILVIQIEVTGVLNSSELFEIEKTKIDNYIVTNDLNNLISFPTDSMLFQMEDSLYYKKVRPSTSNTALNQGDTIRFNYTLKNLDNEIIESKTADEFNFILGSEDMLHGMNKGINIMQQGEMSTIVLPSSMGYGASAFAIPRNLKSRFEQLYIIPTYVVKVEPYEILVFEIDVLNE